MLRLLARSVARVWEQRPADAYAIHLHHLDLGFEPIRQAIVTRLGQRQFVPAIKLKTAGTNQYSVTKDTFMWSLLDWAVSSPAGRFVEGYRRVSSPERIALILRRDTVVRLRRGSTRP